MVGHARCDVQLRAGQDASDHAHAGNEPVRAGAGEQDRGRHVERVRAGNENDDVAHVGGRDDRAAEPGRDALTCEPSDAGEVEQLFNLIGSE